MEIVRSVGFLGHGCVRECDPIHHDGRLIDVGDRHEGGGGGRGAEHVNLKARGRGRVDAEGGGRRADADRHRDGQDGGNRHDEEPALDDHAGAGKGKLMKFWIQSFLLGVPKIIVGFRTPDGILKRIEEMDTASLPGIVKRSGKGTWDGNMCINFASALLDCKSVSVLRNPADRESLESHNSGRWRLEDSEKRADVYHRGVQGRGSRARRYSFG